MRLSPCRCWKRRRWLLGGRRLAIGHGSGNRAPRVLARNGDAAKREQNDANEIAHAILPLVSAYDAGSPLRLQVKREVTGILLEEAHLLARASAAAVSRSPRPRRILDEGGSARRRAPLVADLAAL